MGAAILAAARIWAVVGRPPDDWCAWPGGWSPDARLAEAYDEGFARFRAELQRRGYL